jgi:hypothetical protein
MVAQVFARQELQFPMQIKVMTVEETRQYHLRKLFDLSLKSLGQILQLDEPTYEQKEWVLRRLKDNKGWTRCCSN